MASSVWLQPQVSLRPFCTLRTGGPAERFAQVTTADELADIARKRVQDEFGVTLEEEVLYVGNWDGYGQVR